MSKLCPLSVVSVVLASAFAGAEAQTYSVLHHFGGPANGDGSRPASNLILSSRTLYGSTSGGGIADDGTIFKIDSDGSNYAVLLHCGFPDAHPVGSLVLSNATLFCATAGDMQPGPGYPNFEWIHSKGTVFSVNMNGQYGRRFVDSGCYYYVQGIDMCYGDPPDGLFPSAGLVRSGNCIYGTGVGRSGRGTIYEVYGSSIYDSGVIILKELGGYSRSEVVIVGDSFFGATADGGSNNLGTIFSFNATRGDYTVLKHFGGSDGASPSGSLLLSGAALYGVTESGGIFGRGTVFRIGTNGSDFTLLKHFAGHDGSFPHATLSLRGTTLYGTTGVGGAFDHGTVFQLNTNGADFMLLKHFTGADGDEPHGGVLLDGSALYGTTVDGGTFDQGVLFRLSLTPSLIESSSDGTNFTFSFLTFSNLAYQVEYTANLGSSVWSYHHTFTGDGALKQCVIPITNLAHRFFRVKTR